MSILIKTVRVAGFRGLENLEVELEQTTVLTGMNNTGKTSFLKALQIALGNRKFVSQDDFFIKDNRYTPKHIRL
jgi:putative ATP-dependent endonuclease of OLD family